MHTFETFGVAFEKRELKNGSQLFLFKKKGAPLYLRASINAGTRWNSIPGTAHFVEHMIVAGSKKFPSKNLLAEQTEKIGGVFDAFTNYDSICINVQVAQKEDLPIVTDILNEMLCHSLFDPQTVELERGAILSEIGMKKASPSKFNVELFLSLAFQDTYMKYSVLGTEDSVSKISVEDLINFHRDYFSPARTTYIVCGDVEIDELKRALEDSIELKSPAENLLPEIPKAIHEQRIAVEYFNNKESTITLCFRVDTGSLKERVAFSLLRSLLVGGRASILLTELRYKRGLVYAVDGMALFPSRVGVFAISTECSQENVQQVLDVICNELHTIYTNGVNQESFAFVKEKMLKSKFIEMQTSSSWVENYDPLLNSLAQEKATLVDVMDIIEKITIEEVNEIFRTYIKPNTSYLAVCGRNESAELKVNY